VAGLIQLERYKHQYKDGSFSQKLTDHLQNGDFFAFGHVQPAFCELEKSTLLKSLQDIFVADSNRGSIESDDELHAGDF
jgi:hypothetical protein